jgi:RHS repeat-associated protein
LAGRVFRYDADGRLASAGDAAFEHDAHGFRCARQENGRRTEYAYTPEGLLRRVALPDGREIGYAYDSQGRRVAKFVDGLVAERYAWKGPRLIGCDNGEVSALVYADGRAPLFLVRAGQTYRLCCDQVGTVFAILDAAGRVVKRIEYDAFGNVLSDSNPGLGLPLGFAGGLADADTGLIRFGARDFDPDTGRFTAQDPLGAAGGDRDLYRYCLADPVNLVDPSGMQAEDEDDEDDRQWDNGEDEPFSGQSDAETLEGGSGNDAQQDELKRLYFDGSTLTAEGAQSNSTFPAVSGPHGKGKLPEGNYTGDNLRKRTKGGMSCPDGTGWSLDLNDTEDRKLLRIHPDGGDPGTSGCIGVSCDNNASDSLYELLNEHFRWGKKTIPVDVKYIKR